MKKINIDGTEYVIESDAQEVDYSGNVLGATNVKDALDALQHAVEVGGGAGDMSQYGYFGINFPKQMSVIKTVLDVNKDSSYPRLRFVHISDTHGANTGNAEDLLENTAADFAVHTGDAVYDSFPNDYSALLAKMLSTQKPFYFVIGNHDCYGSLTESDPLQARYNKFFKPLAEHNGLEDNGLTYYSVDYTKGNAKFKCIFLDESDAGINYPSDNTSWWANGYMTDAQKLWFIQQLQSASAEANKQHVLIFIHTRVGHVDEQVFGWHDLNGQVCTQINEFLTGVVDAFINHSTYTFNSVEYSFGNYGAFVGWFCGHGHYDSFGWIDGHPKQFISVVCRPDPETDPYDGSFFSAYPHINYFTVDYKDRKLSLYRVGEQRTWQGTERVSFYIKY